MASLLRPGAACGPTLGEAPTLRAPAALVAFAQGVAPEVRELRRLHLRFERARRLRADGPPQQLVLVSWSAAAVRRGEVQAMAVLAPAAAAGLRRACARYGLCVVDNAEND